MTCLIIWSMSCTKALQHAWRWAADGHLTPSFALSRAQQTSVFLEAGFFAVQAYNKYAYYVQHASFTTISLAASQ